MSQLLGRWQSLQFPATVCGALSGARWHRSQAWLSTRVWSIFARQVSTAWQPLHSSGSPLGWLTTFCAPWQRLQRSLAASGIVAWEKRVGSPWLCSAWQRPQS